MYNSVDFGKLLKDLAVYASFRESLWRVLLYWLCIFNLVFNDIVRGLEERRREIPGHVEV
jgi:hypothetical protein